jgi:hypothetical protein
LGAPTFKICGFYNEKQRFLEKQHFANSSIVASILALFLGRFLMKNHVFSTSIFALIFDRLFGRKMVPKWHQNFAGRSPLLAPFFDPGAQADFWMNFNRLWAPFWRPFAPLWRPLAPFWLPLAPLGSFLPPFGDPWLPFWLAFRQLLAPF